MSHKVEAIENDAFSLKREATLLIIGLCFFLSCGVSSAWGCKYTVRDVAFVEMERSWYQLQLYPGEAASAEDAALLQSTDEQALRNSNVLLEIKTDDIASEGVDTLPRAVLVAPDGRSKQVDLPTAENRDPRALQIALNSIVRSRLRESIMEDLAEIHSVVLIIEGADAKQNQLAKTNVEQAVQRVEASLPDLAKPIDAPPRVLLVTREAASQESILLWALGVDLDTSHTQIAMLFGRGRRLGPVIDVAESDDHEVLHSLAVAGLDCECELDRSWMQSPMAPHVWTEADESRAAKALGFDPGHPLVKVEISRILSRGPSSSRQSQSFTAEGLLPGLQIIELDFESDEPAPAAEASGETVQMAEADRPNPSARSEQDQAAPSGKSAKETWQRDLESRNSTTRMIPTILVGLLVVGVVGGVVVLLFGGRGG